MIYIRWLKNDIDKNEIDNKRGGKPGQKTTEEINLFIINHIENDPLMTLEQLVDLVRLQFKISLSIPTISKILQGALITLKRYNSCQIVQIMIQTRPVESFMSKRC